MIEDLIVSLDQMGIDYTEDMGTLTIDVASMDKTTVIAVVQLVTDSGMEFTIDEASLIVQSGAPAEEYVEEFPEDGDMETMQAEAMDELF